MNMNLITRKLYLALSELLNPDFPSITQPVELGFGILGFQPN
jgi:hypothetical protein